MKYFVNAPARRRKAGKSRKRRTAAQRRATAKMIAANKARRRAASPTRKRRRTTQRSAPVAKRRRKRSTARRASPRRRRRSTGAKRRSPVTRLRRNKVYVTNPRRKRRRSGGYRRNPNIVRQTQQLLKDTGAVLAGQAASGVVSGFLPDLGNPFANAAKGVVVAVGIRMAAARFLGADTARFAAAGAMATPLKNLVVGFLPADQQVRARALLGDYGDLGAYAGVITAGGGNEYAEMGSYTPEFMDQ